MIKIIYKGITKKKDALSNIIKKSQGSSCWMRAIEDVNEKCSKLDDDSKMRIASSFFLLFYLNN